MMNSQDSMIDNNDPRLTAYALGELAPADAAQIEAAIKSSPELQAVVADIRRASETISNVFLNEPPLQLTSEQKSQLLVEAKSASNFDVRSNDALSTDTQSTQRAASNLTPAVAGEYYQPSNAARNQWIKIAIAAGLASVLIGGAYYLAQVDRGPMTAFDNAAAEPEQVAADSEPEASESKPADKSKSPIVKSKSPLDDDDFGNEIPLTEEADSMQELSSPAPQPFKKAAPAADSPGASPIAMEKIKNPMQLKPSGNFDNDGVADSGMDSPNAIASQPKKAFGSSKSATNQDKMFDDRKRSLTESSPSDAIGIHLKSETDPISLAVAQESIDQSALGSLNLTVVANIRGTDLRQGFDNAGGGGFESSDAARFAKPDLPTESWKESKNRQASPNSPAVFALQISDEDARKMVEQLAKDADPLQQRKLSFNDLLGSQAVPLLANDWKYEDFRSSNAEKSKAAPVLRDESKFDSKKPRSDSPASQREVAAAVLAMKLRKFTDQPTVAMQRNGVTRFKTPGLEANGTLVPQGDSERNRPDAQAMEAPSSSKDTDDDKAVLGDERIVQNQREDLAKKGMQGLPQLDSQNKPMGGQPLSEFDFDYSQVIEQLKLKLEIRNRSLPSSK